MTSNPHTQRVRQLTEQYDAVDFQWKQLAAAVDAHSRIDPVALKRTIEQEENRLRALAAELLPRPPTDADQSRSSMATIGPVAGAGLAMATAIPLLGGVLGGLLSGAAAAAIKKAMDQRAYTTDETRRCGPLRDEQLRVTERLRTHREALAAHTSYDVAAARDTATSLSQQAGELQNALAIALQRESALDAQLGNMPREIVELARRMLNLKRAITAAEDYNRDLDRASTKAEKARIHASCRQTLGNSAPGKVIEKSEAALHFTQREHDKVAQRIEDLIARDARPIERLVIDGSNLCYASGSDFIGLQALQTVLGPLATRYPILVVFDANIRSKLRMTGAQIRQALGLQADQLTILVNKQKADETLLRLAVSPGTYIVSNDGYGDFKDLQARYEGRVLPHTIAGGRVLIVDLAIDLPFVDRIPDS